MHATEFPQKRQAADQAGLIVLHGGERHLKTATLSLLCEQRLGTPADQSLGLTRLVGKDVDFKTVRDELQLISMFSTSKIVLVEDADDFVTKFRPQLESHAQKPSSKSLLILELKTWRKNTKLAKIVQKSGLEIECSELEGAKLSSWMIQQAKDVYSKQLSRDSAALIAELAGTGLGLLSQELGKLASYVGDRPQITVEDVKALVGGWKAETTWGMIDAIRDGKPGIALQHLSKLLFAGEAGPKILGGINYVFRKYAHAVEESQSGGPLRGALQKAGVFPRDVAAGEQYLRRMGRERAEKLLDVLAQADYGLKGGSRLPERLQLEQLILWLSGTKIDYNIIHHG